METRAGSDQNKLALLDKEFRMTDSKPMRLMPQRSR